MVVEMIVSKNNHSPARYTRPYFDIVTPCPWTKNSGVLLSENKLMFQDTQIQMM